MPKKRNSYVYKRNQGGAVRFWGDFREWSDVGGKREPLRPKGAVQATTEEKLAQLLVSARIAELEDRRRRKQVGAPESETYLAPYVVYHLKRKRETNSVTPQWLEAAKTHLAAAISFFCNDGEELPQDGDGDVLLGDVTDRELGSIRVQDVQDYISWLANRANGRNGKLSPSSQRKYLNSLSNLFKRAISENKVPYGHNPVAALLEKPQDSHGRGEAQWLEVHDAALLLEAARLYKPKRTDMAISPQTLHAVLATMLLTGGRPSEVLGLRAADVSFDRQTVTFRPNEERTRLKTAGSTRVIRLWPQLAEILTDYLRHNRPSAKNGLLFRSVRTGRMIRDIRKALDAVAGEAGWAPGSVRPYAFRHTYTATRLQTLDNGFPVAQYTVARELGHDGESLVRKVYGHLGQVRHRSEVVEYRVEQHAMVLGDRLERLRTLRVA